MFTSSKFINLVAALSIILLFAFLLTSVSSSVVTAGSNSLLGNFQDHDDEDHEHGHHDDDHEHDHDDHNDDDDDEHEFEEEMMEMEMMHHIFEVTQDADRSSFFAVMMINEFMEEKAAAKLLNECIKETDNDATKRAIRIKLIELNAEMDDQDNVRQHLKALILDK